MGGLRERWNKFTEALQRLRRQVENAVNHGGRGMKLQMDIERNAQMEMQQLVMKH